MKRTIILAAVSLAASTAAVADAHGVNRSDLRHDRKRVAEERNDLRTAYQVGNRKNIADQKRDLAEATRNLRRDQRAYAAQHPHRPSAN